MVNQILIARLRPMMEMEARLWRSRALAWLLSAATIAAGVMLYANRQHGWWDGFMVYGLWLGAFFAGVIIYWAARTKLPDVHEVARKIEEGYPELRELLVTAVEQQPGGDGRLNYLQERVVSEAVDHAVNENWVESISLPKVRRAEWVQGIAVAAFSVLLFGLFLSSRTIQAGAVAGDTPAGEMAADFEVAVDPGDTEVEKGGRLVVQARFNRDVPAEATLVVGREGDDEHPPRRIPMAKNLQDPVFGGVIPGVPADTVYRVEFDGEETRDFTIDTFEFPKLERADATVDPPEHLDLEKKTVRDTRNVSAFEGSEVTFEITLNKDVVKAKLTEKTGWAYDFEPVEGKENAYTVSFVPEETMKYRLELTDESDRANKRPPLISVTVKKNQPPKVALTAPGRDVTPSAIEEVNLQAKIWDDLGVEGVGAVLSLNGETHEVPMEDSGEDKQGRRLMTALLDLESLKAAPDDSITYFVWAEDVGPDGQKRRVESDLFFADVRPFENIFREVEGQPGEGEQQQGGQAQKLIELQREIINATWKLIRRKGNAKAEDISTVHESQGVAVQMVGETLSEVEDATLRAVFEKAQSHMQLAELDLADGGVDDALIDEKDAYAELLKARERERNIMRSQSQSQSSGQQQQKERQLMELELTQEEQRYETEKTASAERTQEQNENLQVLNRLRELARRQEALREEIKELQAALEEAKTEEEKEEIERQLKRLQEEQEQLLRDVDELRERMDNEENQSRMAAEREQLEETREQVRRGAEELKEENLDKAVNAAERASESLEELRDEFQRRTSKQFAQEMRSMRSEARELVENEEAIRGQLQEAGNPTRSETTGENLERALENRRISQALEEQVERAAELMEQVREVSEQAEESEPLLSDRLYESLRKAQMDQLEESLETARDMAEFGALAQSRKEEDEAYQAMQELKEGIERAAERLVGDEMEGLRMARSELDRLIDDVEIEAGASGENEEGERRPGEGAESERGADGEARQARGNQPGAGEPGETDQERQARGGRGEGDEPGTEPEGAGERSDTPRVARGQQPGEGREGEPSGEQRPGSGGEPGEENENQRQAGANPEGQPSRGQGGQQGQEGQPGEPGQQGQGGEGEGQPQPGTDSEQRMAQNEGQQGQGQQGQQGQGQQGQSQQGQGQQGQQGQAQTGGQPQNGGQPGQQPGGQGRQPSGQRTAGGAENGISTRGGDSGSDRVGGARGRRLQISEPLFFENDAEHGLEPGPITGSDYRDWSDRLREVEEMLDDGEMRDLAARSLDRAREMRQDFRRNNTPPNWDVVQRNVAGPLIELRDRVNEEIARRSSDEKLVPLDRDPVPNRYRELVRGYYERLSEGK